MNKLRAYYYGEEYKVWFLDTNAKGFRILTRLVEEGKVTPSIEDPFSDQAFGSKLHRTYQDNVA
ncbi:hypothetical protein J3F83DRAFT_718565 [Trichoderma novae-zelandiae]